MGLLRFVTRWFINFFGITEPTPVQERQAAWFICGLLALTLVGALRSNSVSHGRIVA
jgi:hypothetical protein